MNDLLDYLDWLGAHDEVPQINVMIIDEVPDFIREWEDENGKEV